MKIALPVSSHVERRGLDEGESWVLARPNELANLFRDGIAHKLLTGIRKGLCVCVGVCVCLRLNGDPLQY